jgi:hypothetical protein
MRMRRFAVLFGMLAVSTASMLSQDAPFAPFPPTRSFAEALRSHGITDLSRSSLASELNNSDPQVRTLAAHQLAENHDLDAAPAIESALAQEQDLNAQVEFSEALWALQDQKGVAHLSSMCADSSLRLHFILEAIRVLNRTHSSSGICAETLLDHMAREQDSGQIAMAASLLPPIYRDVGPDKGKRILNTLELLLLDVKQQISVRFASSQALAEIGGASSATSIREAIAQEKDANIRSVFEGNLRTLEKSQR